MMRSLIHLEKLSQNKSTKILLFVLIIGVTVLFDRSVYSVSSSACSAFSSPPIPDDGPLPSNYTADSVFTFTSSKYGRQTSVTVDDFEDADELGGDQTWISDCTSVPEGGSGTVTVTGSSTQIEHITSHTLTVSTEVSFGLSVGTEGTGNVGVTHTQTESNGWQLSVFVTGPVVSVGQNWATDQGECTKIEWESKKQWVDFSRDRF